MALLKLHFLTSVVDIFFKIILMDIVGHIYDLCAFYVYVFWWTLHFSVLSFIIITKQEIIYLMFFSFFVFQIQWLPSTNTSKHSWICLPLLLVNFLSFLSLVRVHEGRKSNQFREGPQLSDERILCLGLSRKRPVLKWENNMAWPGKLTLTDKALYFEVVMCLQ